MESLESKLDRLSPDQRREVEDFVDFLIQRAEGIRVTVQVAPASRDALPSIKSVAPPLIMADPVVPEEPPVLPPREEVLPAAPEPVQGAGPSPAIHEIETDDGYLDYGKFEKTAPAPRAPLPPSPADAAVQKVKRRLIQKSEAQKDKMLDWID